MPDAAAAFLLAIVALLIGTAIGFFVQDVASSLRHNGAWPDMPRWKKRALASTGSIAAFIAGVYVLQGATASINPQQLVFRMWLYQTLAAWAGATALDLAVERFKGGPKP